VERLAPAVFVEIGSKVVVAENIKSAFGPARKSGPVRDMVQNDGEKTKTRIGSLTVESKWRTRLDGPDGCISSCHGKIGGAY
jgi:hypothetical protein